MAYRLNAGEPASEAVRRIIAEEATTAAQGLRGAADRDNAVHEARKSVKKIRALLRLYGKELGPCASVENTRLRDLGRKLSQLRDTTAMLEIAGTLRQHLGDGSATMLDAVGQRLRARKEEAEAQAGEDNVVGAARITFERLAKRAAKLSVRSDGFDSLERGLERAFRTSRRSMTAARKDATDEAFHEWRKTAKDHWYHVRLLGGVLGDGLGRREKRLADLCDWLGDDHNLAVLRGLISAQPEAYGTPAEVAAFIKQLEKRQAELRDRALREGERLYDQKPKKFVRRVSALWAAVDGATPARPKRKRRPAKSAAA